MKDSQRSLRFAVERLEDRDVPAVFGVPWLDGSNLTLSFAPDGTSTLQGSNVLSQTLSALGSDAARLEILRAFQTWAEHANVNIGVVADGGQAYGANGAIQGDTRFGDVRLFAQNLGSNQLAETSPFNVLGGSNAGDIVLNSAGAFAIGAQAGLFDLYSIFLQESGHSLGIGNSDDPNSPMYEVYSGVRTGLTAGDIANLQALYGARLADQYEGLLGNNTPQTAAAIVDSLDADLSTRQDVDFYRFTASTSRATVRLLAGGHSLLTGRLSVLNSSGQVIASVSASDALHNDLTLDLSNLRSGSNYFIRVDSPRGDSFSVGSYRLTYTPTQGLIGSLLSTTVGLVTSLLSDPLDTSTVQSFGNDYGSNDSIGSATIVSQQSAIADSRYDANFRAVISTSADVDYYRLTAPLLETAANLDQQMVMIATVWGLNGSKVDARLKVYDGLGSPVAARVLTNNDGSFTVQVDNAVANAVYYLRVSGDGGITGQYEVATDFRMQPVLMDMAAAGTLSSSATESAPSYLTCQDQLFHFALTAGSTATSGEAVMMNIYDAGNHLVFSLTASAGDTVSNDVFLSAGVYKITYTVVAPSGALISPIDYSVEMAGLTDPVVSSCDSTTSPSGSTSSDSSSSTSTTTTSSSGSPYTYSSSPPPSDSTWY